MILPPAARRASVMHSRGSMKAAWSHGPVGRSAPAAACPGTAQSERNCQVRRCGRGDKSSILVEQVEMGEKEGRSKKERLSTCFETHGSATASGTLAGARGLSRGGLASAQATSRDGSLERPARDLLIPGGQSWAAALPPTWWTKRERYFYGFPIILRHSQSRFPHFFTAFRKGGRFPIFTSFTRCHRTPTVPRQSDKEKRRIEKAASFYENGDIDNKTPIPHPNCAAVTCAVCLSFSLKKGLSTGSEPRRQLPTVQ